MRHEHAVAVDPGAQREGERMAADVRGRAAGERIAVL